MFKYRFLKSLIFFSVLVLTACAPTETTSTEPADTTQQPITIVEATSSETGATVSADGTIDACSLITQAEAEGILGEATTGGQRDDSPPLYSCYYETANFDVVQVVVVIYDDSNQAQAAYEMAVEINGYPEISGLADRAYNAQPIFDVNFLTGNLEVSIDISDSTDKSVQLENSIELAQLVLSRLH